MINIVNKKYLKLANEIKELKIQSASQVSRSILVALEDFVKTSCEKNIEIFRKDFFELSFFLGKIRSTEPEVRNVLIRLFKIANSDINIDLMKKTLRREIDYELCYKKLFFEKIAKNGLSIIEPKSTIFTHCHSRSVESLLIEANKKKNIKVICTETRPLFQGRTTAKNLLKANVPTTLIVDSAANMFIGRSDIFLSGADAITAQNDLVNKIGTSQISLAAYQNKVPHYVVSSIYKFDPITLLNIKEPIEYRPEKEVWDEKIKGLKIENPAFDMTKSKYIAGYITEFGVIPTNTFSDFAKNTLYPKMDSLTKKWLKELVEY